MDGSSQGCGCYNHLSSPRPSMLVLVANTSLGRVNLLNWNILQNPLSPEVVYGLFRAMPHHFSQLPDQKSAFKSQDNTVLHILVLIIEEKGNICKEFQELVALHLEEAEKEEQTPKLEGRKEITELRRKINEIEIENNHRKDQ